MGGLIDLDIVPEQKFLAEPSIPLDVMIEKATPKKPKHIKVITDFNGRYYTMSGNCPSCGEEGLNKSSNYCHRCGQRLDWEVNEHEK